MSTLINNRFLHHVSLAKPRLTRRHWQHSWNPSRYITTMKWNPMTSRCLLMPLEMACRKFLTCQQSFTLNSNTKKGESSVVRIGGPAGLWLDSSDTLIELFLLGPSPHCPSFLQLRSQSFRPSSFPPVRMFTSRGRKTNPFSLSKKKKKDLPSMYKTSKWGNGT